MRVSLGFQVVIAVFFGIAAGIFFGPLCNSLQPIVDVYFMLLQMIALPYICAAIIHGLGSMAPLTGRALGRYGPSVAYQ